MFKNLLLVAILFTGLVGNSQIPAVDWIYTFGGKATEAIIASDMDSQGNILNVGVFRDTTDFDQGPGVDQRISYPGKVQMFIQKIDAQGNHLWVKTFGGDALSAIIHIKIANDGSIYCSGYFEAALFDFNPDPNMAYTLSRGLYNRAMFLLKLDSAGNFQWALAQGGDDVEHTGIAIDNNANLYAAGVFNSPFDSDPSPHVISTKYHHNYPSSTATKDVFIQKIDPNGNQLWLKAVKAADNVTAQDIGLDITDQPVVVGYFIGSVDFDPGPAQFIENPVRIENKGFILRLDSLGNFINVKRTGGAGEVLIEDIAFDKNHAMYLAGVYEGNPDLDPGVGIINPHIFNKEGFFIQKVNVSGSIDWVHSYENPLRYEHEKPIQTIIDDNLNVYACGSFGGASFKVDPTNGNGKVYLNNSNVPDLFIVKHDSTGAVNWSYKFGTISTEHIYGVMLNSSDNLCLSGYYRSNINLDPYTPAAIRPNNGLTDSFIIKFSDCPPPLDTAILLLACEYYDITPGNRIYSDTLLIDTLSGQGVCDSAIIKTYIRFQYQPAFISYNQGILSWDSTNTARYQLTWISCDSGDTVGNGATFTPSQNGKYALIVDRNGCSDTSSCVSVMDVGITENNSFEDYISVYPNPANDILHVSGLGVEIYDLTLMDLSGKVLADFKRVRSMDINMIPLGTYLVRIGQGQHTVVKKFIKK